VTAIRSVRTAEGKFVQISNAALQDDRLSWSARGILAFVLSLPPDQHLTAAWLEGQSPDGRREVRSALRELERFGYYRRTRTSTGGTWSWDQVISDAPIDEVTSERSSTDDTTCGNASSQVTASDRFAPDAKASDASPSDKRSNTEQPKDVGRNDLASRHARAKSSASTNLTVVDAVNAVRQAVERVHSSADAEELSDDAALGLFYTYVGNRRPRNLVTYLAKIFGDGPYIDTFLSNSEAACTRCAQWESNCKCAAA
jgi:hypothetical protein